MCNRAGLNGLINSCVMLGMLLGSLPIGLMADKIGRRNALAVCIVVLSASGTANAFVRSLALFAVLRVLVGATAIGIFYCATVLIGEMLLPKDINSVMKLHGKYIQSLCQGINESHDFRMCFQPCFCSCRVW